MSEEIRELYNSTAGKYDLRQGNPSTNHLRAAEEKMLRKFAAGAVLDIGCGTGHHLEFMEKNHIGSELTGMDISPKMLRNAAKKCGCRLLVAGAECLPFNSSSFDTVICLNSTLNLCDAEKAVREMSRVLRRGGCALLSAASVWDKEYPPFRKKIFAKKCAGTKSLRLEGRKLSVHLFSKDELKEMFEKNGFAPVCFRGLFINQRPYWGRFEDFSRRQKLKLWLDKLRLFNSYGCVYLAAFRKE